MRRNMLKAQKKDEKLVGVRGISYILQNSSDGAVATVEAVIMGDLALIVPVRNPRRRSRRPAVARTLPAKCLFKTSKAATASLKLTPAYCLDRDGKIQRCQAKLEHISGELIAYNDAGEKIWRNVYRTRLEALERLIKLNEIHTKNAVKERAQSERELKRLKKKGATLAGQRRRELRR